MEPAEAQPLLLRRHLCLLHVGARAPAVEDRDADAGVEIGAPREPAEVEDLAGRRPPSVVDPQVDESPEVERGERRGVARLDQQVVQAAAHPTAEGAECREPRLHHLGRLGKVARRGLRGAQPLRFGDLLGDDARGHVGRDRGEVAAIRGPGRPLHQAES
ncbi:MAG: hypothetical protein ACXW0Z_21615, partial [Gemmatirosa sp.]